MRFRNRFLPLSSKQIIKKESRGNLSHGEAFPRIHGGVKIFKIGNNLIHFDSEFAKKKMLQLEKQRMR